jgi:hypothetical protein
MSKWRFVLSQTSSTFSPDPSEGKNMVNISRKLSSSSRRFLILLGIAMLVPLLLISCKTEGDVNVVETNDSPATAVVTEEPVPIVTNTAEPPEPAHRTSGLVFTNNEGTWWINLQGDPELLVDVGYAQFSPDRQSLAFVAEDPNTYMGDVWILDLSSGERINITNTPERDEGFPVWFPGQNVLAFGSDTQTGMTNASYPTMVGVDGTGYEILDQEIGGFRGVSPSGEIFYAGYEGTATFTSHGSGPQLFNPTEYGLSVEKLFNPVWSPDGKQMAWFAAVDPNGSGINQLTVVIFDLENMTSLTLHTYEPIGGSMFVNELTWSPDGEWLAFTTYGEPPATGRLPNLWAIRPDGSDQTYVSEGYSPLWSYDSQTLAFLMLNYAQTEDLFLANTGTWEVTQIDDISIPERIGALMDWVLP